MNRKKSVTKPEFKHQQTLKKENLSTIDGSSKRESTKSTVKCHTYDIIFLIHSNNSKRIGRTYHSFLSHVFKTCTK